MKFLGLAGSPRRNGNTDLLLAELLKGAASKGAEVKTIFLNNLKIGPCQHCDACFKEGKCKFQDDMQDIYKELEQADVIVLASPVQFAGPPAPVKAMIDRTQALWAKKYVLKIAPLSRDRIRKGFLISVGGMRMKDMFEPTRGIVKTWFHVLEVESAGELVFSKTDEKGAILKQPEAMQKAFDAGQKLADPNVYKIEEQPAA
jgi:multimeric flavodoxin WrbA